MRFHFDRQWKRIPCQLSGPLNYVHPNSRERMRIALDEGCPCQHDEDRTAALVMRNGAVWLQCDACGHSLGSAMKRDEHPSHQQYPHWRVGLKEEYEAQHQAHYASLRVPVEARATYQERSAEYEIWCRTAPEWQAIKRRILWRSRGHCEACLQGNAEVVHHLTYEFGKLPPAWHLRAVCHECHERLHDGEDDWCASGMARGE